MEVVKTLQSNFNYLGPEPGIGDLPCERRKVDASGRTAIYSTWQPTPEERAAIAAGANIELGIWYVEPIPPVSLGITHATEIA